MKLRMFFDSHIAGTPAHVGQCLYDVSILFITCRILDAVRCRIIAIPIRKFIEEDIRIFFKEPKSECL